MSERRSLVDGLKSTPKVDSNLEKAFVFGAADTVPAEVKDATNRNIARSPLSTRVRADIASALKRASLERQLSKAHPNSLQDILEEALESWLKSNGYASSLD